MAIGSVRSTACSHFFLRRWANDYTSRGTGGSTTTTSPSWADVNTLTFTPSATSDYLILAYLSTRTNVFNRSITPRLLDNGTGTAYSARTLYHRDTASYHPWCAMIVLTGISGSQTFKIQMQVETLNTGYWNNNFLHAINLSDFPSYHYAESLGITTTSSTSFVDKLTTTPTVTQNSPYLLITNTMYRKGVNLGYNEAQSVYTENNSTKVMALSIESPFFTTIDNTCHHSLRVVRPKTTAPTIAIQHRTQSTANSSMLDTNILMVQLNDNPSLQLNGLLQLNGNTRFR